MIFRVFVQWFSWYFLNVLCLLVFEGFLFFPRLPKTHVKLCSHNLVVFEPMVAKNATLTPCGVQNSILQLPHQQRNKNPSYAEDFHSMTQTQLPTCLTNQQTN